MQNKTKFLMLNKTKMQVNQKLRGNKSVRKRWNFLKSWSQAKNSVIAKVEESDDVIVVEMSAKSNEPDPQRCKVQTDLSPGNGIKSKDNQVESIEKTVPESKLLQIEDRSSQ